MVVRTDMAIEEPKFAVLDEPVGVLEVGLAGADRLDLGSGENHSCLEFFEQEVVVAGVPIYGSILLPRGGRLAARILLPIGLGLVAGLLGHSTEKKVTQRRTQVAGRRFQEKPECRESIRSAFSRDLPTGSCDLKDR